MLAASFKYFLVHILLVHGVAVSCLGAPIDELENGFLRPPADSRIMMRWWWFGPSVSRTQLEREMRLMKEGGIGGFEIQPVYPLVLEEADKSNKILPLLSDEFIEALRFTAEKAKELGLRVDLTLGSGWPFGGPTVTIDHAAARLRYEHIRVESGSNTVKVPSIGRGEKLLAIFLARVEGSSFSEGWQPLSDNKDGLVRVPTLPAGPHEVLFFISSRTGMQVKRPAVGGEGFVLDHLNRAALDSYLGSVGNRLLQAFGANPPYAIFCDSLEVYNSDWSSDFLTEFEKRRGYDLTPHLPALVNEIGPQTRGLRNDWGKTLTELLNERFFRPLGDWSKRNRTLFRIQGYGVPAAAISSNYYADLPEGEGAQWKVVRASRWASSASHLYGRPVTSSETWTWSHSPSFRATPLDLKAEADVHFLQGINQLIGHGWPYTAPGVEYPGWRFYAAGVFNQANPWWIVMPDLAMYLQRVSFMMRQGRPANDVAVYLPNDDGWASFTPGNTHLIEILRDRVGPDLMPALFEAGYNLDFFDDDAFKQVGRIQEGSLILGQNKYKVIILANVERIPIETLQKFEEFARAGGILIATKSRPSKSPGFLAKPEEHRRIVEISERLFSGSAPSGYLVTDEKDQLSRTLTGSLRPDMALSPSASDIGFVHRSTVDAEIFFVANSSNEAKQAQATFRVSGMKPEWWNPFDGSIRPAKVNGQSANGTTLTMELEPYGSRLLVFSRRSLSPLPTSRVPKSSAAIDLTNGWRITFGREPSVLAEKLTSWTDDERTRYFSGVAVYEKEWTLSQDFLKHNTAVRIDFGEPKAVAPQALRNGMQAWLEAPIREAAVVYINDRRAGSVWCPPYSLDVTKLLQSGENRIRILVANTAINHMAGRSLPDYRLLNLRYGERFQPQDMDKVKPITSGLLGQVRLIPETR